MLSFNSKKTAGVLLKKCQCIWTNRKQQYMVTLSIIICKNLTGMLHRKTFNIWLAANLISSGSTFSTFHYVRLPCILQLYGFNFSGSNHETLDCSQFTLSGWHLEVVRPIITPCAPAMQQYYELKNERSGGA